MKLFFILLLPISFVGCKKNSGNTQIQNGPCAKFSLAGTWIRTDNGNGGTSSCVGEVVISTEETGTIQSVPQGCIFPTGKIRWYGWDKVNCTINNLYASDPFGIQSYTYSYSSGSITFFDNNTVVIHGVTYKKQ